MEILKQTLNQAWNEDKASHMVQSLDHKDPERILWSEFLDWFNNEGRAREKIHNAGLYQSGLTRIVEDFSNVSGVQPSSEFRLS